MGMIVGYFFYTGMESAGSIVRTFTLPMGFIGFLYIVREEVPLL